MSAIPSSLGSIKDFAGTLIGDVLVCDVDTSASPRVVGMACPRLELKPSNNHTKYATDFGIVMASIEALLKKGREVGFTSGVEHDFEMSTGCCSQRRRQT